jgi:thiamine biosynthesis lipoprotein ApbE
VASTQEDARISARFGISNWRFLLRNRFARKPSRNQEQDRLSGAAIATSGDLLQRLDIGGQRYSHILDPHIGVGMTDHSLVSVIAPDCITADSLTKVVSVLSPEKGIKFIEDTPRVAAWVIRQPSDKIEAYESRQFRKFYDEN